MQIEFLTGRIVLSAKDAVVRGLPPVMIEFDAERTGLMARPPFEKGFFITMGGPPGGPCRVTLEWIAADKEGKLPSAEMLARREDTPRNRFNAGSTGQVEAAGAARESFSWTIQPTPWREQLTGILIPVPAHRGAIWLVMPGEGLLTGPPKPSQHYLKIVKSLAIRP